MKGRKVAFAGRLNTGKDTAAEFILPYNFVRVALADELKRLACRIFLIPSALCFGPSNLRNTELVDTSSRYWEGVHRRIDECENWINLLFESVVVSCEPVQALHELATKLSELRTVTVRLVLQWLGTEWGRTVEDTVWIRAVMRASKVVCNTNVEYTPEKGLDYTKEVTALVPPRNTIMTDARFPNEAQAVIEAGGEVYWIEAGTRVPAPIRTHASEPTFEELKPWITGVIMNDSTIEQFRINVIHVVKP